MGHASLGSNLPIFNVVRTVAGEGRLPVDARAFAARVECEGEAERLADLENGMVVSVAVREAGAVAHQHFDDPGVPADPLHLLNGRGGTNLSGSGAAHHRLAVRIVTRGRSGAMAP